MRRLLFLVLLGLGPQFVTAADCGCHVETAAEMLAHAAKSLAMLNCVKQFNYAAKSFDNAHKVVDESIQWDDKIGAYIIKGPFLLHALNYPGIKNLGNIPSDTVVTIRVGEPTPKNSAIDRVGGEQDLTEEASCDYTGALNYKQTFRNWDGQPGWNLYKISFEQNVDGTWVIHYQWSTPHTSWGELTWPAGTNLSKL